MSEKIIYQHDCTKCGAKYEDNDPDAYLCVQCKEERKEIARQVDAKLGSSALRHQTGLTPLQEYLQSTDTVSGRKCMIVKL